MKNDLTCAVVRDLLPSYIDKLTSEETNRAVEQHLEGCEDCRRALSAMQGEGGPAAEANKAEPKEIDYLKKVRTGTWKRVIAGIVAAAFVFGAGAWIKVHRIGNEMDPSAVNITNVVVSGDTVAVAGNFKDKSLGVTRADMRLTGDGVMEIGYRAAKKDGKDNDFDFVAQGDGYGDVREIRMGDRIVWYQGEVIGEEVSALYNARHAYVGDMSANGRSSIALGINDVLGPYTNELQTAEEPYGWTLFLEYDMHNFRGNFPEFMTYYSAMLLATIENLGSVTFSYTVDGKEEEQTLTAEQATQWMHTDIKKIASDPVQLQYWMQQWKAELHLQK